MKKLKIRRSDVTSTIVFNKEIAMRFSKTNYYKAMGEEISNLSRKQKEKAKYSTPRSETVTKLLDQYKQRLSEKSEGIWQILYGIYKKNKLAAANGTPPPTQSNLLYLVSSIPMLVTAYRTIRSNKGANTLAYYLSSDKLGRLNPQQRRLLSKTFKAPDGLNNTVFKATSRLLRSGEYPWGASRRIYIEKPGQPGKLRPITIPPFMDRVVQSAIRMILEAIYEPWFEHQNCNFGYRPNKGVHDAMVSLTCRDRDGLFTAIEGDIKGAYDNVDKNKLISLLGKRITDRKFLNLMGDRLDYQYFDCLLGKYRQDKTGIPQGGIDSPYLWNIYMLDFDEFIHSSITNLLDETNNKLRGSYREKVVIEQKYSNNLRNQKKKNIQYLRFLNKYTKVKDSLNIQVSSRSTKKERKNAAQDTREITKNINIKDFGPQAYNHMVKKLKITDFSSESLRKVSFSLIRENRKLAHRKRSIEGMDPNRRFLRFVYARYADDWIILGNFPKMLAEKIKILIKDWLAQKLSAQLSEDKTLITDMRKHNAHFLGFELKTGSKRKLAFKQYTSSFAFDEGGRKYKASSKSILAKVAGQAIVARPDRQRLISRLHMKGFCDKKGFPRELPWLSCLEPFSIIERYNSVLSGFANYYAEFIKYPSDLYRWLYIVRYSCFKTLAQKYRISIRKVLKTFYTPSLTGKTISVKVTHKLNNADYTKEWKLLTAKDCILRALSLERKNKLLDIFYKLQKNEQTTYNTRRGKTPRITDEDFLEKITWTNLRTTAQLDLPCFLCGSTEEINMHHIKSIRKTPYSKLSASKPWLKLMALRNRKQIPVCRSCHMNVIHKGTHQGSNLRSLAPISFETLKFYDNRLAHVESYIKPGQEYFGKSLEEKGWIRKDHTN